MYDSRYAEKAASAAAMFLLLAIFFGAAALTLLVSQIVGLGLGELIVAMIRLGLYGDYDGTLAAFGILEDDAFVLSALAIRDALFR